MSKTYLEKWSTKNPRTKKRKYYMHRLHPNGAISDDNAYSSRSGRSRKINRILEVEPNLIVRFKETK